MNLTREQIGQMPAGRGMDALIAEHVMGWRWYTNTPGGTHRYLGAPSLPPDWPEVFMPSNNADLYVDWARYVPRYSTIIEHAWDVAARERYTISPCVAGFRVGVCNWSQSGGEINAIGMTNYREWVVAETAQLAICRAALLARLA